MTHEAGIEAAIDVYDLTFSHSFPECDYRGIVEDIVKAYLTASNMVLLPKDPTKKMLAAASKAMSPGKRPTQEFISNSQKHKIRYQAMVAAYTEIPLSGELQDGA